MVGYIKDWRKELESDIWMMPPLYGRVWQWIKLSANHKDAQIPQPDGSTFLVKKGQRLTSLRGIAEGVKWMEGKKEKVPKAETIGRVIKWLEAKNMISVNRGKCDREYTLITIVKWDFYQSSDSVGVTDNGTPKGQPAVQSGGLNNNDKECNKNDNNNLPQPSVGQDEILKSDKHPVWGDGLTLLVETGLTEAKARSFLGRAIREHGEGALSQAISATMLADPADPKSYLMACLKNKKNKVETLEWWQKGNVI